MSAGFASTTVTPASTSARIIGRCVASTARTGRSPTASRDTSSLRRKAFRSSCVASTRPVSMVAVAVVDAGPGASGLVLVDSERKEVRFRRRPEPTTRAIAVTVLARARKDASRRCDHQANRTRSLLAELFIGSLVAFSATDLTETPVAARVLKAVPSPRRARHLSREDIE